MRHFGKPGRERAIPRRCGTPWRRGDHRLARPPFKSDRFCRFRSLCRRAISRPSQICAIPSCAGRTVLGKTLDGRTHPTGDRPHGHRRTEDANRRNAARSTGPECLGLQSGASATTPPAQPHGEVDAISDGTRGSRARKRDDRTQITSNARNCLAGRYVILGRAGRRRSNPIRRDRSRDSETFKDTARHSHTRHERVT